MSAQPIVVEGALSVDEIVALVCEEMESTGQPASLAAAELFVPSALTFAALSELAWEGLLAAVNEAQHRRRGAATGRNKGAGPSQADKAASILEELRYIGADRKWKTLASFTVEDWAALRETANAQASTWRRRRKIAARVEAAMVQHAAMVTSHLPAAVLAEIEGEVAKTW